MSRVSLFARVRWDNVARLGAVLAVVAVVVAWPRLAADPPVVPEGGARPVVGTDAPAPAGDVRAAGERSRPPAVAPKRARPRARRPSAAKRTPAPARTARPRVRRPRPVPATPSPPAPAPAPPPRSAVAAAEFGVE